MEELLKKQIDFLSSEELNQLCELIGMGELNLPIDFDGFSDLVRIIYLTYCEVSLGNV